MAEPKVKTESLGYPMPGDVLDEKYRLDEIINAGGMGVIMRARQLTMDRDVAVKLLLPDRSARETTRTRFMREIHLAKQLTHPNTIRLYDYGKHGAFLYLVMELLSGRDLKAVLKDEGPLHVARALDIVIQAADAVNEAHERNIVHRDLKPGNLFIQRLGSNRDFVKVLDFGIAKSLESGKYDVTSTGEVSGTVAYLSPEMVRGKKPDKRADVYALGVLFMEMITGRKIFEGVTVAETLMNQMQKPPAIPPSLVNTPLAAVLERALTKNPDERYQDASELLAAFNGVVSSVSTSLRITDAEIREIYGRPAGEEDSEAEDGAEGEESQSRSTRIGYAMALEESETVQVNTDEELASIEPTLERETNDRPRLGLWIAGILGVVLLVGVVGALMTPRDPADATPKDLEPREVAEVVEEPDIGAPEIVFDAGRLAEVTDPMEPAREAMNGALELAVGVAELDAEEMEIAAAEARNNDSRERDRRPKPDRAKKPPKSEEKKEEVDLDVFGNLEKDVPKKTDPKPSESPAELRAAAKKAFLAGDYSGCVTNCKKALAGGETGCHALLANAYRQLGNTKAACRHYKAAGIAHKSCITLQSR